MKQKTLKLSASKLPENTKDSNPMNYGRRNDKLINHMNNMRSI